MNRIMVRLAFKMNFALALALALLSGLTLSLGCGVRGDPLPPAEPPVLGHGTPDFPKLENKLKNKKDSKGSAAFHREDWDNSEDHDEMRDDKND